MTGARLRRSWWTKAGLVALVLLTIIYFIGEAHQLSALAEMKRSRRIIEGNPYLIDTPACRIPNLQAESPEAMEFMSDFGPIDCGKPPLVESNDTHLEVMYSVLPYYGITDPTTMSCCYRAMWRNVPNISISAKDTNATWLYDKIVYDNDIRYSHQCVPIDGPIEIYHHFVRVECVKGTELEEFYRDFHAFFPKPEQRKKQTEKPLVNVLLLGIDSLSRLNMIRKMPRTLRYLRNTLKGIPMFGYNKMGLNTFPNLIPLLSGYTEEGLLKACWGNETAHFDLCPWIWDKYAAKGYRTAYMEDSPNMALFTYMRNGFAVQRTDYDASTMFIPAQNEISHEEYHYCLGTRNQIEVLLNYTLKQVRAMKRYNQNFLTFSWGVTLSHDLINQPQQGDPLYHSLLQTFHDEGILNNTFMIFLSDHGLRFGDFLQTAQGRIEGNLPALFFVAPDWFHRKYSSAMRNLRGNQYSLLTTLDIHATLLDLADLSQIENEVIRRRAKNTRSEKSGISLFLPLPDNRSCPDANIPDEFCTCEHLKEVDVNLPEVGRVAQFIVDEINYKILRNDSLCVPRTLSGVHGAAMGLSLLESDENGAIVEYEVQAFMKPGDALFSALVRHFTTNDSMRVVGEVSRLNKYGTQSQCMSKYSLLPFCFCKDPTKVAESSSED